MKPVRVLLVDDSPVFLGALQCFLKQQPGIEVVGVANNGIEALEMVAAVQPTVIVCDVQMPKMSGIEFLKALLPKHPIPVVVISGTPNVTLTALQGGAVDFIPKPAPGESREVFFFRLTATIRTAAIANVRAKTVLSAAVPPAGNAPSLLHKSPKDFVIAIGASTGGTDAILSVVRDLPANTPGVLITQHMPAGFTAMYASRLDRECKMRVFEAKDGMRLEQGTMILAAGLYHMQLAKDGEGYYVTSREGAKVSGHIPSVDVLFDSVAALMGKNALGIILTGMGADGAEGLLHMRQAGAYTIGQDEASSVVYGMPMVAYNRGAVAKQLPLAAIPDELLRHLSAVR